ncbi:hypothetical protein C8R44DRAFT_727550 [Mycena epipterygia]|nr:hypothetical protein C8R44DRAFT_727550 [Mycena epipterygia]
MADGVSCPEIVGEENLGADHRVRYDLFTKKNAQGLQRSKRPTPTAASREEYERTTLGFEKKKLNLEMRLFINHVPQGVWVQPAKLETKTLKERALGCFKHLFFDPNSNPNSNPNLTSTWVTNHHIFVPGRMTVEPNQTDELGA